MWKSQLVTRRQWPKVRHETMFNSLVLSLLMLSRPLYSCFLPTLLGLLSEIPKTLNLFWMQLPTRRVKTLEKISDQAAIRATRVEFFSKINKRPWSFIRDRRVYEYRWVLVLFQNWPKSLHKFQFFPTLRVIFSSFKMSLAKTMICPLQCTVCWAIMAYKLKFWPQHPSRFSTVQCATLVMTF